jgi:uncharacterized protein DUF927
MPDLVHGRACLLHYIKQARRIESPADLPADVREAIGWTEPYTPPEGVPPIPTVGTFGENGFYVVDQGVLAQKLPGKPPKHLCTFDAWITEDVAVQHDDGREAEHVYVISGFAPQAQNGHRLLPPIRVKAADFGSAKWETAWGYDAFLYSGRSTRDHVTIAVRDRAVPEQVAEYTSPGWHDVGGKLRFLHCQGAVGDVTVRVTVPGGFERFVLPPVPDKAKPGALETLWLLKNLTSSKSRYRVTGALLGCVFRAPLCHWRATPMTLYLVGATGIGKSTLAAVATSYFGNFRNEESLFSWASSPNALENLLYVLKDHIIPMDDVVSTDGDRNQIQERINRVIRTQANQTGKRRMTAQLDERVLRPPRGLPLVTGEIAPTDQSLTARTLLIELEPGELDLTSTGEKPIDRAQARREFLRHCMAGYVEWLSGIAARENLTLRLDRVIGEIKAAARKLGLETADKDSVLHNRMPNNIAQAATGLRFMLDYFIDVGVISKTESDGLHDDCVLDLMGLAQETSTEAAAQHEAISLFGYLQQLVQQGRLRFLPKGRSPVPEGKGNIPVVGWHEQNLLYFRSKAFGDVYAAARAAGEPITKSENRIYRDLNAQGILDRDKHDRHLTRWVNVQPGRDTKGEPVYCVLRDKLEAFLGTPFVVENVSAEDARGTRSKSEPDGPGW